MGGRSITCNWRYRRGPRSAAIEFYVDLLGFRVLDKPPILAARGGRWYQRDDAVIHLGVDPSFVAATKAHPALVVDDYASPARASGPGRRGDPPRRVDSRTGSAVTLTTRWAIASN